jgi:hypothetical protein
LQNPSFSHHPKNPELGIEKRFFNPTFKHEFIACIDEQLILNEVLNFLRSGKQIILLYLMGEKVSFAGIKRMEYNMNR